MKSAAINAWSGPQIGFPREMLKAIQEVAVIATALGDARRRRQGGTIAVGESCEPACASAYRTGSADGGMKPLQPGEAR